MKPCIYSYILIAILHLTNSSAARSAPPPVEIAQPDQPGAAQPDADVRRQFEAFRLRFEALEKQHAEEREQDRQRIAELEAKIAEIQRGATGVAQSAPPTELGAEDELEALVGGAAPAPATETTSSPLGLIGSSQTAIQSFNPDISVNGNFLGTYRDHQGGETSRKFDFSELELGFSGAIDPYTRADVIATIGFEDGEYSAELEEAYMTFLQLPYNLQARAGKYRAEFGRSNPIHLHALPWPDYPFVIQRYFGEEGLSGTGGELSWLIPNPWNQYLAVSYELFNNDNGSIFAGDEANDLTHLLRLKTFYEFSPASTLELGASVATAPNDRGHGSHRSTVEGCDLTFRWKPKEEGLYRSFLWQTEVLASQADIRGGRESTWGMYSAAEYQFARRWKVGLRYDNTQLPFESSLHEYGYSAYLTFMQTEFLFWRLAYMNIDRNFRDEGVSDEQRVMMQLNFTLGTHPAHKF